MIEELSKEIFLEINLKKRDIREYSPLVLAYLGDAVYELFIRTLVLSEGNAPVCKLHKLSTGYVKAEAQSATIHKILESLHLMNKMLLER